MKTYYGSTSISGTQEALDASREICNADGRKDPWCYVVIQGGHGNRQVEFGGMSGVASLTQSEADAMVAVFRALIQGRVIT